jgi:hypothetical protein
MGYILFPCGVYSNIKIFFGVPRGWGASAGNLLGGNGIQTFTSGYL